MRAVLVYSALRVLIFAAAIGLGYLLGLRSWALLLVAALVSAVLSLLTLKRQRSALSVSLSNGSTRLQQRLEQAAAKEDQPEDEVAVSAVTTPPARSCR